MHSFNLLLLAAGLLVFISLLAGVASTRLGLPFLLVFLVAGMVVGVDGPFGVHFDNAQVAAWVATPRSRSSCSKAASARGWRPFAPASGRRWCWRRSVCC